MRNFTWNRFPIKNLLIDSLLTPIAESTYLNRDMCKFESSQKDESRWQSTDSSKAYRKTSAFTCFQQKWKKAGWDLQIHNQYFQSQAHVFPWSHFSIQCILLRKPGRSSKPSAMLFFWRGICFYPAKPESTGESAHHQFKTTNLRQRHRHQ